MLIKKNNNNNYIYSLDDCQSSVDLAHHEIFRAKAGEIDIMLEIKTNVDID